MKVSALYLIALGLALIWPAIAKRSFQADLSLGKNDSTAGSLTSTRMLQGFLRPSVLVFGASFVSFIAFFYIA